MIRGMGEEYVLGHRAEELARLDGQAKMLEPATRLALQLAGIGAGMRVVDLGTGTGEVALLVAELVGPEGSVLAVDRAPDGLAYAATKFADRGVTNIELVEADVASYAPDEPVDAVLGRLVLSYLPDPVATIRRLLGRAQTRVASTWRSSTTPRPCAALRRPRWSTRLARTDERRLRRGRHPADAGPAPGRDAARGRRRGRAEPRAAGLPGPGGPLGPAMLAGVIGSLVPAITAHGLADPAELESRTCVTRSRPRRRRPGQRWSCRRWSPPGDTRAETQRTTGGRGAGPVDDHVGALADALAGEQLPLVEHELPPELRHLLAVALQAAGQPEVVVDLDPHQHRGVRRERGAPLPTPSTTSHGAGGTSTVRS